MDDNKRAMDRKNVFPAAESFKSPDASGWMFKHIHEGWLRKRWRRRYCVLSNGILYFYEQQSSDGAEKTCSSVDLKRFETCVQAPKKECKKSPNTIILEPAKSKDGVSENGKGSKKVIREYLCTDSSEEMEEWILKLKESISLASIGGSKKLQHITKSRARPSNGSGGNRRPPSKQHLKERAMMSETTLDEQPDEERRNGAPKARGHIPLLALKPLPGGKTSLKSSKSDGNEASNADNATENGTDTGVSVPLSVIQPLTPKSPKPPSAALKPRLSKEDDKQSKADKNAESPEPQSDLNGRYNDKVRGNAPSSVASNESDSPDCKPTTSIPSTGSHTPDGGGCEVADDNLMKNIGIHLGKIEAMSKNSTHGGRIIKSRSLEFMCRDLGSEEKDTFLSSIYTEENNGLNGLNKKITKKGRPYSLIIQL